MNTKILIVLNNRDTISTAAAHLTNLGYDLHYASDVFEAMAVVNASRPDLALVSWQLKSANVRSVVDLLTERLKIRCIVFGEENDPSIAAEMTKAGFATTLPPPFYGPTAHSRIQQILSKKTVFSKTGEQNRKNEFEFVENRKDKNLPKEFSIEKKKTRKEVSGENVPGKTTWEKDSEDEGMTIWKGTSSSKKGRKSFYYFKGVNIPKYNPKQKVWEVEKDGVFYLEKNENKELARKNYRHLLAQCLDNALLVGMHPSGEKKNIIVTKEVVAILINSTRFKGYLIAAGAESSLDQDLMEKIFAGMKENLAEQGVPLTPFKTMKFNIDPIDFFPWAKTNAEFVVSSQEHDEEIAFAFLPITRPPEFSDTSISGYVAISVSHGLIEGEPLLFDTYLHLPKNQKFIRYLKKGSCFDARAKAKYVAFAVTDLFIKSEDLGAFFIYCVKARIKSPLNELDQKAA